jgi:RNA polymerase sigma-70 factor (ECF subfamily)
MDAQGIYQRYAADVLRFAHYLTGDRTAAEDLASEAFVRLWTAPGEIRTATVKAYLFAIVRNLHSNARRSQRAVVALDGEVADPVDRIAAPVERRSEAQYALRLLARIAADDRAALLMRAADVAYDDIARELGITVAAAKVRVHRARMRLATLRQIEEAS